MFYSTQILAKKGPLGTVWIASHLDRRLKRSQVFETNLSSTVDNILNPEAPLALRLSGQLLLGVVKIYSRKVAFLFDDCNEALVKVTKAFKPADVDLPPDGTTAPLAAITLPDNYNVIGSLADNPAFDLTPYNSSEIEAPEYYGGKRDSLLMLDDFSSLAGSQPLSFEDERFDIAGEDVERHLSMSFDRPERLRDAPIRTEPLPLYSSAADPDLATPVGLDDDDRMIIPPDDDFDLPHMTLERPASDTGDPSPALATPAVANSPAVSGPPLGELELRETSPLEHIPGDRAVVTRAAPAARLGPALGVKKRRVKLDMEGSMAVTELAGDLIRALIHDRSSLLRDRSHMSLSALRCQLPFPPNHVAWYSDEARESDLHRPGVSSAMPRELYQLYARHMVGPSAVLRRKRKSTKAGQTQAASAENEGAVEAGPPEEQAEGRLDAEPSNLPQPLQDEDGDLDMSGSPPLGPSPQGSLQDAVVSLEPALPLHAQGPEGEELANGHHMDPFAEASPVVEQEDEEDEQEGELGEGGEDGQEPPTAAITERTKKALTKLQASFLPENGRKRKKSGGDVAPRCESMNLESIVEGHTRLDASRWFFEMLVLKTRDYVELSQAQSYGDIIIRPCPKLMHPLRT
eukprot:jgi/Botrbrau1/8190/Bobra.357_2s0033.1